VLRDHLRSRSRRHQQEERRELGFLRQPGVQWLSPPLLLKAGIEAAVSSTFGKFADKRELETAGQDAPFDYADRDDLWIDFLSDTGDGWEATYTMAWLLAQGELEAPNTEPLPRGDLLLLGGDQVYPAPGVDGVAYEDRFVGPFAAASPDAGSSRDLFAIPGNHDWYDGLISFLRIFCRPESIEAKQIGSWKTRQRRSYWALRLPHRWWMWATDIQLDTYIDNEQLTYFKEAGKQLREGDKVILITAKPSWVKADEKEFGPASWRNLAYFERTMIRAAGGTLALTLTGDLHHYSRYEPEEDTGTGPTRITAGGGGAYLSATHPLPDPIGLIPEDGAPPEPYRCRAIYPEEKDSKRLSWGVFLVSLHNPAFGLLLGAVYAVVGAAVLGSLNVGPTGLVAQAQQAGLLRFLANATGGTTILLAALLAGMLFGYADFESKLAKLAAGFFHALVHLAVAFGVVYLAAQPFHHSANGVWLWGVALLACLVAGIVIGSLVFALYLFVIHRLRGNRSPRHTNEVFASQGIRDFKNFLRLHIDPEGHLTVYPLGVRRVCRHWDFQGRAASPWFTPRPGEEPQVELIEKLPPLAAPSETSGSGLGRLLGRMARDATP
jgi:calcineurin-like phosphoesterase family protein